MGKRLATFSEVLIVDGHDIDPKMDTTSHPDLITWLILHTQRSASPTKISASDLDLLDQVTNTNATFSHNMSQPPL